MKALISRSAVAAAAIVVCLGSAQAEELSFTEIEARLAKIESQLAVQTGIQQAAYCNDCGCGDSCCGSNCGCCDSCCGNSCCGCGDCCGCCDCCNSCGGGGGAYGQVDILFVRTHTVEEAGPGGKTAEEYEFSPRIILGFEDGNGHGARVRWWHYGHDTRNLNAAADAYRVDVDVLDLEYTNRFQFRRTDVTLGGGFRLGNLEIGEDDTWENDLIGLTVAADVESLMCCDCRSYWSFLYGARMSILAGDWEISNNRGGAGNDNGFFNPNEDDFHDDNIVVTELYLAVEYGCSHCGYDLYGQLKFEVQNWHSDAFVDNANADFDSIGFVGPGFAFGVGF